MKKLFWGDEPAAGAVFGSILSTVSLFCFANLFFLFEGFCDLFFEKTLLGDPVRLSVCGAAALLQLGILIYSLILILSFFFRQDRSRSKLFAWGISAVYVAALVISSTSGSGMEMAVCWVLVFAGFNTLCIRKHNYLWYIAQLLLWIFTLPGLAVILDLNCSSILECGSPEKSPVPMVFRVWLVYAAVLFFAGCLFCCFKLWASAENQPLNRVWGRGCNVLMVIMGVVYVLTLTAALHMQEKSRAALVALENNFQRKISVDALKDIYFHNRRTDDKFHLALRRAFADFMGDDDSVFYNIISEGATLDKIPDKYRQKFFSPQAEVFGKFFDAPLPARSRNYQYGKTCSMLLPELQLMRNAARFFSWQIRFACESGDHDRAMQAWRRSAMATEYLQQDTSLIASLVLIAVESIRLDALELMLSSNLLTDAELSEIQLRLRDSADRMPELNRHSLYCEAVGTNDFVCGVADGAIADSPEFNGSEGISNYRFLAPGFWYLAACNYHDLLVRYNVENLCKVDDKPVFSLRSILANMMLLSAKRSGERMHEIEMRYRSFVVLLEAERIKRKTGKYPETLPLNTVDYFSGKPLRYRVGSFRKTESFLKKEARPAGSIESGFYETLDYREKTVPGVAVWSIGSNKVDDSGISGTKNENGEKTDDIRAVIMTGR